ncbi:hypothetical protein OIU79_006792 [Salix purpurea]|uniref:Uncharacterized protein n=1 Tax=Salix purpurea TaxID=77065 RepID=A0A9Q0TWC5_SALPP|nr:hypothetical protein OIU79_006792 [Salix purpurea]
MLAGWRSKLHRAMWWPLLTVEVETLLIMVCSCLPNRIQKQFNPWGKNRRANLRSNWTRSQDISRVRKRVDIGEDVRDSVQYLFGLGLDPSVRGSSNDGTMVLEAELELGPKV